MGIMEPNKRVAQLTIDDRELIKAVQHGLPLVSRPYQKIAETLGTTERDVVQRLQKLINNGAIKRFGVIVRHRELGYRANGMVVWDVPDHRIDELGTCIGRFACVTLSYHRPRRLPQWPYNLFTMVHGRNREEVMDKIDEIIDTCKLQDIDHKVLFSTRRFKQRGASYTQPAETGKPAGFIRLKTPEDSCNEAQ